MRKVIFLDIDGVLSPRWWDSNKQSDNYGCLFDAKAVANFAKIIEKTDAQIVVSSSTDIDSLYIRGMEIKGWLVLYGDDVSNYVIIDDMDDILSEQQTHFVQTDPEFGITNDDVKRVVHLLNT